MRYKLTTYKTLTGTKTLLEAPKKDSGQWIIYENNEPTYFVDCLDIIGESNLLMNDILLNERKSIDDVINDIIKNENVKLSLAKPPIFEIKVKSEEKDLELQPLPEEWIY